MSFFDCLFCCGSTGPTTYLFLTGDEESKRRFLSQLGVVMDGKGISSDASSSGSSPVIREFPSSVNGSPVVISTLSSSLDDANIENTHANVAQGLIVISHHDTCHYEEIDESIKPTFYIYSGGNSKQKSEGKYVVCRDVENPKEEFEIFVREKCV